MHTFYFLHSNYKIICQSVHISLMVTAPSHRVDMASLNGQYFTIQIRLSHIRNQSAAE